MRWWTVVNCRGSFNSAHEISVSFMIWGLVEIPTLRLYSVVPRPSANGETVMLMVVGGGGGGVCDIDGVQR
jgi:hypothetical protein